MRDSEKLAAVIRRWPIVKERWTNQFVHVDLGMTFDKVVRIPVGHPRGDHARSPWEVFRVHPKEGKHVLVVKLLPY